MTIAASAAWKNLRKHVGAIEPLHLRDLLKDEARCRAMTVEAEGIYLDFARQNATPETFKLLLKLAEEAKVREKIRAMYAGERINTTEDRAVLHVALRAPKRSTITHDGTNVVDEVHEVLDKIRGFSERVRSAPGRARPASR